MSLHCACPHCRGTLHVTDIDRLYPTWDRQIQDALRHLEQVDQPLWPLVPADVATEVLAYLHGRRMYRSVQSLKATSGPQIIEIHPTAVNQTSYAQRLH